jgi:hypothetical protein
MKKKPLENSQKQKQFRIKGSKIVNEKCFKMNANFEVYSLILFWNYFCFWLFSRFFFRVLKSFFRNILTQTRLLFLKKLRLSAHVKKWKCRNTGGKASSASLVLSLVHVATGIGIPVSASVRYRWSRIIPVVPSNDIQGRLLPFLSILFKLCCTGHLSREFLIWIDEFSVLKNGDNMSQTARDGMSYGYIILGTHHSRDISSQRHTITQCK